MEHIDLATKGRHKLWYKWVQFFNIVSVQLYWNCPMSLISLLILPWNSYLTPQGVTPEHLPAFWHLLGLKCTPLQNCIPTWNGQYTRYLFSSNTLYYDNSLPLWTFRNPHKVTASIRETLRHQLSFPVQKERRQLKIQPAPDTHSSWGKRVESGNFVPLRKPGASAWTAKTAGKNKLAVHF